MWVLSQFSFSSFFLSLLWSVPDICASTRTWVLNWTLTIYWHSFPTIGHLNQKPSKQHSQDNHIISGHLNRTSCLRYAQVVFFAFRRTWVWFRQARQSLLLFLREYGNSHSLPLSNSCSQSHWSSGECIILYCHYFKVYFEWEWLVLVRVLSMGQVELFNYLLYLKLFNCK